ncbi:Cysteine desulfurase [Sporotomaculum syntrophicum]|uniref:cysteine desulfurase n=1 Tax=Sporotomaculum syntrophicum TaxID=182264 RepID=A0A9D2WN27_9FIRM|nr:cysteine desulfurase family protein [Sporotomaculum syntrophicum]KAF1084020.1 Cysteine desulfurase [Sporotomaculum syntrophicum]
MRVIYFDHSATTPVNPVVADEMYNFLTGDNFGNPSSLYRFGRMAREAIEGARNNIALAIGANPSQPGEIVFTSGGTESDNLAIHGAAYANRSRGNHIITSAVEHHAVLNTVKALGQQGFKITILPVDQYGMVDVRDVAEAITDQTILITIMHANNEVGTIMPIAEIGKLAQKRGITFHVDAVQSFGKIPVNVDELRVDLLTISGHKIYGPKGTGALYIRTGAGWKQSLLHGGAQERLRRAGTENVPGIVGLGKAVELIMENMEQESKRLSILRDKLIKELTSNFKGVKLTGHPYQRLPNHASFLFEDMEGEELQFQLDAQNIAASTGSACTSGSMEPSHVLLAMGVPPAEAYGSLRLTLGAGNSNDDVDRFLAVMGSIIENPDETIEYFKSCGLPKGI